MANLFAIHSVGQSLVTYLRNSYPSALQAAHPCDFRLLSTGELATKSDFGTTLSLLLYRVTTDTHTRNVPRAAQGKVRLPLCLDLHYLLTVWADNALAEHVILAWAMRQIHEHGTLGAADLSPEAEWDPADVLQLIAAELTVDEMMRVWDELDPPYRLSVGYVARVVRIDGLEVGTEVPVVARRLIFTPQGNEP